MKKQTTASDARQKIFRYCAYQERCHKEVRDKLYSYGLHKNEVEDILTGLITEGFLNEERFARAFAGGKFRMQKWGRIKIVHELEARGLTPNCIKAGLKEIDEQDYAKLLRDVLKKRAVQSTAENPFVHKDKLARYAIQKGFEPDLVWSIIKSGELSEL
ncbi:MAG TPA: regulatory protein RecX [Ohtaekwangia sp.]|nr:regulatory protein RecX [Ohtaekwangia sp.]